MKHLWWGADFIKHHIIIMAVAVIISLIMLTIIAMVIMIIKILIIEIIMMIILTPKGAIAKMVL